MSTKNTKKIFIVIGLCMILAIGSAFAYLYATNTMTNVFTVGNVTIDLTEPNWNEDNAVGITPNQTIAKDPMVTNIGNNDAYVFMRVNMPKKELVTVASDGSLNNNGTASPVDLFSYDVNNGWQLIKTEAILEDDTVVGTSYIYAYATDADTLTTLSAEASTPTLFDDVTFVNALEGVEDIETEIVVDAFAIQTSDLGVTSPSDVWDIVFNQTGGTAMSN